MSGIITQNTLDSSGLVKAPEGGGAWNFISKLTASSSATLSFTSGIDATYKEYIFTFKNIHPETDSVNFTFNMSEDSGSNYNVTKTTSFFESFNTEAGSTSLSIMTSKDLAQGTGFQDLCGILGNANDENLNGYLHLFNPSSTTFVKHFLARISGNYRIGAPAELDHFIAGYGNTTSAVDAIQFKMSADAIDAGDICLYGISS